MYTIIGDVHGKYSEYLELTKKHQRTIQIGDFGFDYTVINTVNSKNHKLFAGNHDNPSLLANYSHNLGRYGKFGDFFFVSGANSIDKFNRQEHIDWFSNEELNYVEMSNCIDYYSTEKPEIVLSHDCPTTVCKIMHGDNKYPSNTDKLLEMMFSIYHPRLWIFGHHHRSWQQQILGTKFVCLNELETYSV